MQVSTFAKLALSLSMIFAAACGGSQKHAASPDPTEKGWSGASTDAAETKADPSIQSTPAKSNDPAKVVAANGTTPESGEKPEAMSQAEADIVAGRALPPSPKTDKAEGKPVKPKKPAAKTRKKPSKKTA
jgi:hypothetical protein